MVRPKKSLGQHFLRNPEIAAQLAAAIPLDSVQAILEVGPGTGVLTRFLEPLDKPLWVTEIDTESVRYLEQHFPRLQQHIIPGDILHLDPRHYLSGQWALVGNYPYNISSQIIFRLLEWRQQVPVMVGMFQKEVADRLVAPPGSRTYGILSVLCDAYFERELLFDVERENFYPPPKVRSAVIRMTRKPVPDLPCSQDQLRRIVKTAFNQRRKTLRNALKSLALDYPSDLQPLLSLRAEQLHYTDFARLGALLPSSS